MPISDGDPAVMASAMLALCWTWWMSNCTAAKHCHVGKGCCEVTVRPMPQHEPYLYDWNQYKLR